MFFDFWTHLTPSYFHIEHESRKSRKCLFWPLNPEEISILNFDLSRDQVSTWSNTKADKQRKCFFDLWTRKKPMFFLPLNPKETNVFWPLTWHKQTNKQTHFNFFRMTLPSVEGIRHFLPPNRPFLSKSYGFSFWKVQIRKELEILGYIKYFSLNFNGCLFHRWVQ
jgi:hypothetical protein